MMWWIYIAVFFAGVLMGAIIMALMAAQKNGGDDVHEIHVYHRKDGNVDILTFPSEDKVINHYLGE